MTRTDQKKELMEVLQDVPIKMAERFKRDFERMAFDNDVDFNDWIDDVCLEIDHKEDKNKSVKRGLEDARYYQQKIRGLSK